MSSVEDAAVDRIRLYDLLTRRRHAKAMMEGVWADLLWGEHQFVSDIQSSTRNKEF
jgi:hypothetical protein